VRDGVLFAVTLLTALGCGLNGGVFFAFSSFVMPGLARLPAAQGNAAMQSMNVTAVTPPFMAALFGTALGCLAVAISAVPRWREPGTIWLLAGSLLYLVGTILVTIVCNVPRNNALAATAPDTADGAARWADYLPGWTVWNTVRAIAGLLAATALTIALIVGRSASVR